jgi:hypothetical protein
MALMDFPPLLRKSLTCVLGAPIPLLVGKLQAAVDMARKRWDRTTAAERFEVGRELAHAKWNAMTAEERSVEMSRRRLLGLKRTGKVKGKVGRKPSTKAT